VNGDISDNGDGIELTEPVDSVDIFAVEGSRSSPQGMEDTKDVGEEEGGIVVKPLNPDNDVQTNKPIKEQGDLGDHAPTIETRPTTDAPPQSGDQNNKSNDNSSNGSTTQQRSRNHHHHHHHHHHHRRGQHQHQHQQPATQSNHRPGGVGSVSPEKTIKIMSQDAKTQFVFRAFKSRDDEPDAGGDKRDMLIQTDVISINDNNEKSKKKLLINLKRLGSKDEPSKHRLTKGHTVDLVKDAPQSNPEAKGRSKVKGENNQVVKSGVKDEAKGSRKKKREKEQGEKLQADEVDQAEGETNVELSDGA
ncbi:hypothetical protein EGW08_001729, partial [Elysia chlorotica]